MPGEEFKLVAKVKLTPDVSELEKEIDKVSKKKLPEKIREITTEYAGYAGKFTDQIRKAGQMGFRVGQEIRASTEGNILKMIGELRRAKPMVEATAETIGAGRGVAGAGVAGMVIGAIVGKIDHAIGVLGDLFDVNFKQLLTVQGIVRQLKDSSPLLQNVASGIGMAIKLFFMPFGNILGLLLRPLMVFLLRAAAAWLKIWKPIQDFFKDPAGALSKLFDGLKNSIGDWAGKIGESIQVFFGDVVAGFSQAIAGIGNTILGGFRGVIDAILSLPGRIADEIGKSIGGIGGQVKGGISQVGGWISGAVSSLNVGGW